MTEYPVFQVDARRIENGAMPLVIAEAGVNHNGDPDLAIRLVDAAADAGADAVKFQTFRADELAGPDAPFAEYQRSRVAAQSQHEMLRALELSDSAMQATQEHARRRGIIWFSTPFDVASVDVLEKLSVPLFKIGSGDLTNHILLRAVARRARPIILSTGMATVEEIESAIASIRTIATVPLALMQCVSAYPAPPTDINLRAMGTLADKFRLPVGFSDHTVGIGAPIAAAALGACAIEKHLTLDRSLPGPDHAASLDPAAFQRMVTEIHTAHDALGNGIKRPTAAEDDARRTVRRSLVAARPLAAGATLAEVDFAAVRPGYGMSPTLLTALIGRRIKSSLLKGEPFTPDVFDPPYVPY